MLSALIASLISFIKFRRRLKECLVIENTDSIELFEYKGKTYDRKYFIINEVEYMLGQGVHRNTIAERLDQYESNLVKSKTPDFDTVMIDIYKIVLANI